MRRWLVFLSIWLVACQALSVFPLVSVPLPSVSPTLASPSRVVTSTPVPATPTTSSTPLPVTPSVTSTLVTATPLVTSTPLPATHTITSADFEVRYHPDGQLYVGDQVSLEVIAPPGMDMEGKEVTLQVEDISQEALAQSGFAAFGLGYRTQATFNWAWDTSGLEEGEYDLRFSIQPGNYSWTETVNLLPELALPLLESNARWETVESECCVVHYITGTDADQDLEELLEQADAQASQAVQRMGIEFSDPIQLTILPRVLGHGGFAGDEIYISYLDGNYAGNDFSQVLHHEMIHILDGRLGGELRPSLFVEGLAVYLTGGHFKKEPLFSRAATLLDLDWYIPIASLADSFYTSQHEVGYLESAALIQFLIDEYGWDKFDAFYRGITTHPSGKQSQAIDVALQSNFGVTLTQLESQFKERLDRQPRIPGMIEDVRLTVEYFDTVRRYQQILDPSAYFLNAWLPQGRDMRERGLVADYLRHPRQPVNQYIERVLLRADQQLRTGDYVKTEKALSAINALLDRIEASRADESVTVYEEVIRVP